MMEYFVGLIGLLSIIGIPYLASQRGRNPFLFFVLTLFIGPLALIFLRTQKERIIPYVITMFFYWWMYYLSRNFTDQPIALKFFYLGIFVASAIGMTVNNFMKVSLHAMGIAGLTTAVILVSVFYPVNNAIWVPLAVLLTALVISARLVVSDHSKKELVVGLFIGVFTQVAAYLWVI